MFSQLVSRIIILVLGNLYPAYASFKAVKSKNAREYARWMMYWIVFAIFAVLENFTDIFLSWFPFYYELKILFVVWLLLPTFKGSSFIYRKLLHPYLVKNEQEIDQYIERSKELGSQALVTLGKQGIDVAQRTIAQKGPVWRSVSAQYLDQIMSNRDIDYNAEDQTDSSEVISQRVASRVPSKQRAIPSSTARDQQPQIRHRTNSQGHITQPQSAATGGNYLHPHSTDENIRNHSYVTQTQSLQPDDFIHIERSPNNKNNNNNTKMSNKLASTDVGFNNENEVFEPQQFSNNYVSRQQMNGEYFDNAYLTHDDSIAVDQVQKPISSSATRSNATRSRPGAESYIKKRTQPIVARTISNARPGRNL
ncbi:receptor expression-enhancing protein 4-like isoform X1 [Symsagittifera roscoffensis]|uniref:receptor expression-enhancing protein 4-like isoform X1 n=1 Tax=Symsagittifera roscoffensis TaxID=84072 RepID=UPI00307B2316